MNKHSPMGTCQCYTLILEQYFLMGFFFFNFCPFFYSTSRVICTSWWTALPFPLKRQGHPILAIGYTIITTWTEDGRQIIFLEFLNTSLDAFVKNFWSLDRSWNKWQLRFRPISDSKAVILNPGCTVELSGEL